MNIYEKLAKIQSELFVPKGQKNDFGKYNYRSCEDILKTVKPLCEKNKCVLMLVNSIINVGDRNYVEACAELRDLETGETIATTAQAREEAEKKGMDGSQITGSASSYARKYALAGLFCIDNEKDSDATNAHGKEPKGKEPAGEDKKYEISAPEMGKMKLELLRTGYTEAAVSKTYGVKDITELTHEQYDDFMERIKEVPDRGDVKKGMK